MGKIAPRSGAAAVRLTVYTDYSLRMLMYLAVKGDGLATIAEVADAYGISKAHLTKVAHQLGLAGYVETVRGKGGGLRLARPAERIGLGDVVRRTEPDMALVPCFEPAAREHRADGHLRQRPQHRESDLRSRRDRGHDQDQGPVGQRHGQAAGTSHPLHDRR